MSTTILHPSSRSLRNTGRGLRAFLSIFAIVAAMLVGTNACHAAGSGVLDNGAFFSEQAKSDAAKVIGEMERTLHEDLAIETFKEIPAELKAGVNVQDKAALGHLFEQWASKQFKQKGVNGVYVLIVKEPAHLQISVGNNTQRQAFTLTDRDALSSLMRAKLHAHQNDEALRDGANFVFATMKSHTNPRARTGNAPVPVSSHSAQSSGGTGGWLIPALVIGVVVWLVIGLFRALSGRMGGGSAMGQAGGGGGFLSSLVGGMFGAAAGMWMYDQFFSNHGNSAYGSDRNDQNGGDSGFSGQDTDSTSSGGDFGSDSDSGSSGGSDFGGGGGDFGGGGDSGGGGDF